MIQVETKTRGPGLVFGLLLLSAAGPAPLWAAGQPADTYSDSTTTLLVEVPVEVTSDGKPVRGLSAENFELFDNGRAQQIVSIDVVDLAEIGRETSAGLNGGSGNELPVAARRHFLLLFDHGFSTPKSLQKARDSAFAFVEKDLHPTDLVAVGTFSVREGLRVPLGFTPDRTQVQLAIQQLGQEKSMGLKPDPLRIYMGNKSQLRDPGDDISANRNEAKEAASEQAQEVSGAENRGVQAQGRREVKILSDSLKGLAGLMRKVNGRKHVIYFSEGFDSSLLLGGQNEQEVEQNFQASAVGQLWKVDSDTVFGNRSTLSALDQLTEALRKADCTLHSVDVAGIRAGGDQGVGAGKRGKDGLFLMARDTGGELFENFNDLGTAMNRLLEKTSVTYLISYRPQDLDFDGKYRKLKVKLKNVPDARIVHRPGYFAPSDKVAEEDFGTLLASAEQLFDRRKGEIEASVLALPLPQVLGERRYVPTFVDVTGASFLGPSHLGRERPKNLRADVFLYAFDQKGGIVDFFSQAISLDLGKLGEDFEQNGFRLYAPLLLAPGDYTLRVLVRDPASGRSGIAKGSASVAAGEVKAALLPPMLPEKAEQRVLVRGHRKDLEGQKEPDYPFSFGSQVYAPAAGPRVAEKERLPLLVAGWGLQDLQIEARLLGKDGVEVALLPLTMSGQATITESGLIQQLVGFTVPALTPQLGPGTYQVEVTGKNGDSVLASGRLSLTLDAAPAIPAPDRVLAFVAPVAGAREQLAQQGGPAKPAEDAAAIEKSVATLREQYRQALSSLHPRGGDKEALDQLEAFELAALGDDPQAKAGRLSRAEMEVARKLAASDVESLLPLLQVHQDLFLRHKVGRRPFLELHSRQMVVDLAVLYAERGRSEGSKVAASRALSSLGGYLLESGRSVAIELFEKAAALDPRNEAAYLGLAAFYEKRGGPYELATAPLQKLVEARPESREGRLRLAINLLRMARLDNQGEKARLRTAEDYFRALLSAPENDWVTSLAAQELARFEAGRGQMSAAVQLLEKTLEKRPDDQELLVQLTFYYDRLENNTAAKLLERVGRAATGPEEAPRGRYNQWQSEALTRDRNELLGGARQRLAILGRVLETTEHQEGR